MARIIIHWFSRIRSGRIDGMLPDGRRFVIRTSQPGPTGELHLHAPARLFWRALRRGALGFGESYVAGDWSSPQLGELMTLLAINERHLGTAAKPTWSSRAKLLLEHWRNRNTRRRSRRNIEAHYDLGNEFYRLWLDEGMTYSGAVFATPDEELASAQERKYQALIEALGIRPGDRVLEIGCGWGGFAQAAARAGALVTGVTLSREQLNEARERIDEAGLNDAVSLELCDYREVEGQYDHVVSIEMLEAVGEQYWATYFDTLYQRLRPGGRVGLHGITIDPDYFEEYRTSPDFIQRYVFPGGMLPTAAHLHEYATSAGLTIRSEDHLGDHYARTLDRWHQRFLAVLDRVREQGFDERFIRIWRYYLAYCEGGFRSGRIDLNRLILERPGVD
jgi:cyclopropane-fatty-acyl-phospholipid synthase